MGAFLPPPGQPSPKMDPNFKSTSLPAITRFKWDGVEPPSNLYLLRDDILYMEGALISGVASAVVQFFYRFLRVPEVQGGQPSDLGQAGSGRGVVDYGIIETGVDGVFLGAGPSKGSVTRTLGEGYLLGLGVVTSPALQRGQTFVRVALLRQGNTIGFTSEVLLSDYATLFGPNGWPGGRILNPAEGTGWRHSIQVANPGAGADWTMTVPANMRRSVIAVNATYTASAAAANRIPELRVDDGVNVYAVGTPNQVVVANAVVQVTGLNSISPAVALVPDVMITLPANLSLRQTHRLRSNTANIQAADQWSAIWLLVEDWIDEF